MQYKHKAIFLAVIIMLMGAMLTGCVDRDNSNNNLPPERTQPTQSQDEGGNLSPPLPGGGPGDPNWVPPEYPGP